MSAPFRIAFFGLPLAACLLARRGHRIEFAALPALSPLPGRRRLHAVLGVDRLFEPAKLGADFESAIDAVFTEQSIDLLVSWFWPKKIPPRWLERPRLGGIGAHPSLLPRHRGPNPYFWAIDQGDEWTGVSVHVLTPGYDEGDVLACATIPTGTRDAWQLARALDRPSLMLLRDVVEALAAGRPPARVPQDSTRVTWAPEPRGEALRVCWSWPTERVLRRIRALSPVPGLALEVRGIRLFVARARAATEYPAALAPGEAATLGTPPTALVIRTGDAAILVERAVLGTDTELGSDETLDSAELAALVTAAE